MRQPMTASLPIYEERAPIVNLPPRHADEPFIVTILINKDLSPMCLDTAELLPRRFKVTGKAKSRFSVHCVDPLDYIPYKATTRANGANLVRLIQRAIKEHTGVECVRLCKGLVSGIFDKKDEEL